MLFADDVVRGLRVAKVFREDRGQIKTLDFSPGGDYIVSGSDGDQIVVYDVQNGKLYNTVNTRKYGVDRLRFAPGAKSCALHSSTKIDHNIRYLSLNDNKYIHYFKGHDKQVVSLCVSPFEETFVTGSLDKSIKLWDLRSPLCRGHIDVMGTPVAAIDPDGIVIAVGIDSETLQMFDLRLFGKKPFITVKLPKKNICNWTDLKFSQNGLSILITTNGPFIKLINAFDGSHIQTFTDYLNYSLIPIEVSFSPDSQYIFSGSSNGRIHVWNAFTGRKVCILNGGHSGPVYCVKMNPKYMMMATACKDVAFWLPKV